MRLISWPTFFRRILSRNTAAAEFDRLLREHIPYLYRCAHRWIGDTDRAEDLVQELLLRVYPKLDELRGLEDVRSWTTGEMYRIFIDQLRRERSLPVQFSVRFAKEVVWADEYAEPIDDFEDLPGLVEQQLTHQRVAAGWAQLAGEYRVVLSLHDIEGYSLLELTSILEIPLGTLKSRLQRARLKLHSLLTVERFRAVDRVCG